MLGIGRAWSWAFALGVVLQVHRPAIVDADCTCVSRSTGDAYPAPICCNLGSTTCPGLIKSDAACLVNGEMCPRPLRSSAAGHLISASISWRAAGGNSVEFEIISTWRYSFTWAFSTPVSTYSGPCGYPGVGDVVPLVGVATFADGNETQTKETLIPQHTELGNAYLQFESGEEGKDFDLLLEVQSFSVEEDWVTGVSKVLVEYSGPYARKTPYFPVGQKYVASAHSRDSNQPYRVVPWEAKMVGCCREYQTKGSDGYGTWDFSVTALVDLTDTASSLRIVTMPKHWLEPPLDDSNTSSTTQIQLCAIPVVPDLSHRSFGTLNWPLDDNRPITIEWEVLGDSDMAEFSEAQGYPNCRTLNIRNAAPWFRANSDGTLSNFVSVGCSTGRGCALGGCAMVTAEISLTRVPLTSAAQIPVAAPAAPFACAAMLGGIFVEAGFSLTDAVNFDDGCLDMRYANQPGQSNRLELRYVVGTARAQSGLLATAQDRVSYSRTAAGREHAGLPEGATFSAPYGIQDVKISLSSDGSNSRPLQDVPYAAGQRDYAAAVGDLDPQGSALAAAGYVRVPGTNFNSGAAGGAIVGVYYLYGAADGGSASAPASAGGAPPSAVTGLRLVDQALVVAGPDGVLSCPSGAADGYELLPQNLLEESGRGGVYLLIRRGSGPPVVRITANATLAAAGGRWNVTTADAVVGGAVAARVTLYFQLAEETSISRTLEWQQCVAAPQPAVICVAAAVGRNASLTPAAALGALGPPAAAAAAGAAAPVYAQSAARCLFVEAAPKAAPPFSRCAEYDPSRGECGAAPRPAGTPGPAGAGACGGCGLPAFGGSRKLGRIYSARMGEEVRVPLVVINSGYRDWDLVSVDFAPESDVVGATPAGAARGGARIVSVSAGAEGTLDAPAGGGDTPYGPLVGGFVSWFPSAADGAFNGSICVRGCYAPSACSGGGQVCTTYCVQVYVERCVWQVGTADSLTNIAARFRSNWLEMWYLNPKIMDPDEILLTASDVPHLVAVGRLYPADPADTIASLEESFGVPAERLISLNADLIGLASTDSLAGRMICIVADACSATVAEAAAKASGFPA